MTPEQFQAKWSQITNQPTAPPPGTGLYAQIHPQLYGPQAGKAQPVKKRGGILASLISEAGGAGGASAGAAGGAAIGSVVPGIGTAIGGLAGAIIGGFAGGTGGKLVEDKYRTGHTNLKAALGEGALDGALSGVGGAFQAYKGIKAASAVGKALPEASNAVAAGKAVAGAAPRVGVLQGAGRGLKSGAMGFGQGATLQGEKLGANASDDIGKLLSDLKIPATSPEGAQRALEGRLGAIGKTLDSQYKSADVALTKTELNGLKSKLMGRFSGANAAGLDAADLKYAQQQVNALANSSSTVNDVWNFSKTLTRRKTNFGVKAGGKLADQESVAREIRQGVGDWLNGKVPGLAQTNSLYHRASNANDLLKSASTNIKGGGLISKATNLSPVRAAEAKVGAGLEKVGEYTAGTGGRISQVTNQAIRQAPGNLVRALTSAGAAPEVGAQQGYADQQNQVDQGYSQDPQQSTDQTGQEAPQSLYSLQDALMDIQRDPKNTDKYLSVYKTVAASEKASGGGGPNIGKVSAQQYQLAQQGSNALGQFAQLLQNDPGVISRSATPGRNLPVVGGLVTHAAGTGQYDTLGFSAISSLLRAQSGAAVPDSEVRSYMNHYLPRAGDNQQTVAQKLSALQYAFQTVLQGANNSYATDPTTADLTAGGGY